jgi:hypothetical protein
VGVFDVVRQRVRRDREVGQVPADYAFGAQREAIECGAQFVAFVCSGRAGKTRGALLKWLEVCERKPGQLSVFVALTQKSAKRIAWRQLRRMDKEMGLGLKFNVSELSVTHPNGSQIVLLGANRDDLIDTLRGFPIVLALFDEAAFWRADTLKHAIEDAVMVRLLDYGGECWVMSTPGYICAGMHYELVTHVRPGWRVFRWTYLDNPHLPEHLPRHERTRARRLKEALAIQSANGWTDATPSWQREFLGQYFDDIDARVYKFTRQRNVVAAMPESWTTHPERWVRVLGIDYGSTAGFALVLWAWERHSKTIYGVRAAKWYGKAPSETADITKEWVEAFAPHKIVGDSAAKGYIDEARLRHQLPIQPADKLGKRGHIELMNDAWLGRRLLLVAGECEQYADELEKLGWDPRYADKRGHPSYRKHEDPNADKDLCDAGLYGWVASPAFAEQPAPEPPPPNPYAGTAFAGAWKPPTNVPHQGLRGAFGLGRLRRPR